MSSERKEKLLHPIDKVYFRAGLLACREYMARFLDTTHPEIAASIRANWWPSLGKDYGPPRLLEWSELTEGEMGTDGFRILGPDEVSPTQEALPIALGFLSWTAKGEGRDMTKLKLEATARGFARADFKDMDGADCSVQESSLATDDAIWLGCNTGMHHRNECLARMHLSREQVEALLPLLTRFVNTGRLS